MDPKFINHQLPRYDEAEMKARGTNFYQRIKTRRSVREFSTDPIPKTIIEQALLTAGTAPNGANLQPWHFAVVESPDIKKKIRIAAEEEENAFYSGRAPKEWLDTLSHLGTDENKPFLESAPALIVVFQRNEIPINDGGAQKTYYPKESTGIAVGLLITALHEVGLATLTHTPSPMNFLNQILGRPKADKPFVLLVVGYPAENCSVPHISKKPIEEITSWH